jgi:KDO2-lipid IV(A) lauroyltransferase
MQNHAIKFNLQWLLPKYWGVWLIICSLRAIVLLPYRLQLAIAKTCGKISIHLMKHRRHVTETNLKLCFPKLSNSQIAHLLRQNFISSSLGLLETIRAWYTPNILLHETIELRGIEQVNKLLNQQQPMLLCGAHFTCLELIGRLMSKKLNIAALYQEHKNPLVNYLIAKRRNKYLQAAIGRNQLKQLLRHLQAKTPVWYAPDQDYGRAQSVFAPFFNIQAATTSTTARLAKKYSLAIIPTIYYRLAGTGKYVIEFLPKLEQATAIDPINCATQINKVFAQAIEQHPEQYLWQHRRFKTRPPGEDKVYSIPKRKKNRKPHSNSR